MKTLQDLKFDVDRLLEKVRIREFNRDNAPPSQLDRHKKLLSDARDEHAEAEREWRSHPEHPDNQRQSSSEPESEPGIEQYQEEGEVGEPVFSKYDPRNLAQHLLHHQHTPNTQIATTTYAMPDTSSHPFAQFYHGQANASSSTAPQPQQQVQQSQTWPTAQPQQPYRGEDEGDGRTSHNKKKKKPTGWIRKR